MADTRTKIGDVVTLKLDNGKGAERPLIVTSVNPDNTVNGRVQLEPGDNPNNDGNVQTFFRNVKA